MNHQIQKELIEKLLAVQQKRKETPLTKPEQQEIATQLGLSEADWQAVQETYKAHLVRGKGFLEHQNYDDAITELEQANVLDYNSTETTAALAKAHFERFREYKNPEDKKAAIAYSRICLQKNPTHAPSLKIISEVKRKTNQQAFSTSKEKKLLNKWLYVGVPVLLLFVVVSYFYLNTSTQIEEKPLLSETETQVIENTIQAHTEKIKDEIEAVTHPEQTVTEIDFSASEYEIPVEITDPKLKNLEWQTESVSISKYDDSYSVEAIGDFLVKNAEINELKIKLEFLDEKGNVVLKDYQEVVDDSDLPLRRGDLITFRASDYQEEIAPKIVKLVLSAAKIQQEELTEVLEYEPAPKIAVTWKTNRPTNTNIEVAERYSEFSGGIFSSIFHKVTLEVKNTGNTSLSNLKFQFDWYDKNQKKIGSEVRYAVSVSTSKLKRNNVRVVSTTMSTPKLEGVKPSDLTYKLNVIEVK